MIYQFDTIKRNFLSDVWGKIEALGYLQNFGRISNVSIYFLTGVERAKAHHKGDEDPQRGALGPQHRD